jgi:penicillin-binding protein-related factor A (putative recombinase)
MPKLTIDGSAVSYKGIYVDFEAPQAEKFLQFTLSRHVFPSTKLHFDGTET